MSSDEQPRAVPAQSRRWSMPEMWTLGLFSVVGLIGFIATFVLIVVRAPDAQVPRALTAAEMQRFVGQPGPAGERGPAGPAGARGPAGEPGVRVLRADCTAGACTVECTDDEVLLTAYCSPNRAPAVYPAEHSAQCRAQGGRKVEVVAACMKAARR